MNIYWNLLLYNSKLFDFFSMLVGLNSLLLTFSGREMFIELKISENSVLIICTLTTFYEYYLKIVFCDIRLIWSRRLTFVHYYVIYDI